MDHKKSLYEATLTAVHSLALVQQSKLGCRPLSSAKVDLYLFKHQTLPVAFPPEEEGVVAHYNVCGNVLANLCDLRFSDFVYYNRVCRLAISSDAGDRMCPLHRYIDFSSTVVKSRPDGMR